MASQHHPAMVADLPPLDAVDRAFRLLMSSPDPLTLDGRRVGHGLPRRHVRLDELADLLTRLSVSARDACWKRLVRRSRSDGPAWIVGATAVALPGLRHVAARLVRSYGCDPEEVDANVLAGFVAALSTIDVDRPGIAVRLCWAAYRGAARGCYSDARCDAHMVSVSPPETAAPPHPWEHPDLVLVDAVTKNILTALDAELIARTRLEKRPLSQVVQELGVPYSTAKRRRATAEPRLARAILHGDVRMIMSQTITENPYSEARGAGDGIAAGNRMSPAAHTLTERSRSHWKGGRPTRSRRRPCQHDHHTEREEPVEGDGAR